MVVQTNRHLDTDWASPLMCTKTDVLFSIDRVVRVWCGMLDSTAGFLNNGGMFEWSVAGIQNTTVKNGVWNTIYESIAKCTHKHHMLYIITKVDHS